MFKLPVCPHCGTIYRYKDVRKVWGEDIKNTYKTMDHNKAHNHTCYHCQKEFRAQSLPDALVLVLMIVVLNIGTLLFMLSIMTDLQFGWLFVITFLYIALFNVLLPFFIKFKKIDKKKNYYY
ncbi:MAG: hypothetical protein IJ639_07340 [Ruminococcus sp.]|nr:hypothetical protein [Ruminococcus sp.]